MLLSKSIALSILAAAGTQALLLPNMQQDAEVFKLGESDGHTVIKAGEVSAGLAEIKEGAKKVLDALKIELLDKAVPIVNALTDRQVIPHKYIVVMKDQVKAEEVQFHQEWVAAQHFSSLKDVEPSHEYFASTKEFKSEGGIVDSFNIADSLVGYSGFFLDETIELIRKHPMVQYVEKDTVVHANEFEGNEFEVQKGAPWGLARVSHRQPLSLNSFNQYLFNSDGGDGVTSYIIDTGINVKHVEFEGRAKWGSTVPAGDEDVDGNGHGTHCAGTIASKTYGVAKNAEVVAVKVLRSNGSGSMSDVVKGVEFAAKSHQSAVKESKKGFKGSTANMSLGGGKSPALDTAVNAAVKLGIHFAVAAGNENQDACNTSPASAEGPVSVGASTISDARAYFSNYGTCVDIFAPGLNILSTYIGSDSATATLSGTSMASPHIAGLLSYYLSLQPGAGSEFFSAGKGVSTDQLKKNLIHYGTKNILSDIPDDGTPNVLAFNGAGHNLTEFWDESQSAAASLI